jgi:hypothetical protein
VQNNIREEGSNNNMDTSEKQTQNKNRGKVTEQHGTRNKFKEELQMIWYKVRLLQMLERHRLPELRENNTVIQFKKERNGITEELLKENETDKTDINRLIYVAATAIRETVIELGKTVKYTTNKDSWKIRIQRQICDWRNELSIVDESGIGSDNIKLNIKKRFFL